MIQKFFKKYMNLINQMAGTFKQQPKLASQFYHCKNGAVYSGDQIKQLLKNEQNINNDVLVKYNILMKIIKYDNILSNNQIIKIIEPLMTGVFSIKNNSSWINDFINANKTAVASFDLFNINETHGLFTLYLNINPFKKASNKEIYHQITHFFQGYEKQHQINSKQPSNDDQITLKNHGILLSQKQLTYLLQDIEIIPHINDLCYSLKKLKNENKKYQDMKNSQFIDLLFKTLSMQYPMKSDFCIDVLNSSFDKSELTTFYLTYYLNIDFQRIKKIIKDDFKD